MADQAAKVTETANGSNVERVLEKYDREHAFRKNLGKLKWVVTVLAVGLALFQLYTAFFGTLPSQLQRAPHLTVALAIIFLLYPWKKGKTDSKVSVLDILLALLALGTGAYHVIYYDELVNRFLYTDLDIAVSVIGVLLTLEAARRVVGLPLVTVASLALLYAYFGPYIPGFAQHQGFSLERISTFMFLGTEGILGIPIAISSTFIFLFLFFGVVLRHTGISQFFNDLAFAITGRMVGGPAKAAVVASAFQGMVTGSSVANTVGSGSFTIPLMKKTGYRPEFAAAVEASASTGGQLMPPIMGAAAFLMIEFIGMEYGQIALAAAIPAVLYFSGIFIAVHLESKRVGILGMPADQIPRLKEVMLDRGYLLLPLLAIIGVLIMGQSPNTAALIAILMAVTVGLFEGGSLKQALVERWYLLLPLLGLLYLVFSKVSVPAVWGALGLLFVAFLIHQFRHSQFTFRDLIAVLEEGTRTALGVIAACGAAGIIVGVVTLTGLGLKVAGGIIELAGGILILTMFFTMIACIILGMGVPTTANYVIMATMAAPAIIKLDPTIPLIAVHLFVFYFGIVADITPPVALAAYAGAGIANSNPFKTGVTATKLAVGAFLIPYIFVLNPVLVLEGATWWNVPLAVATALIGMFGVSGAMLGYFRTNCNLLERFILFAGGISLIDPGLVTDVIGIGILALIYFLQARRSAR
ncbi:TRAP transporter 4TM/12TM fusion protein [Planifilum fimeticola]|uniref:TRAP transporter 4TM/12TM fusion protein n=1 Tax=Planifilum fimeticola TaxID=201975 RepID=A0A2T0LDL2_9BACL|nr:TRAP transporter permease [Planifilum fimeticola]PRX40140.1 TRAP transporter 4TM/12TM fusion protein [Planifilum fimeticola]